MIGFCIFWQYPIQCIVPAMPDLAPPQIVFLKELQNRGFSIVVFPIYANHVGVRKGNCGALLAPRASGLFEVFKEPAYLSSGNLTARIKRSGKEWFVWKGEMLEASENRRNELKQFASELSSLVGINLSPPGPSS